MVKMDTIDEKLYHQRVVHLDADSGEKFYNQTETNDFDCSGIDPQIVSNIFTSEEMKDDPKNKK
ncbi:MAG: hypothetical protein ABSD71_09750 [Bacteroidales bacterium]|jgi:hypothetical protein